MPIARRLPLRYTHALLASQACSPAARSAHPCRLPSRVASSLQSRKNTKGQHAQQRHLRGCGGRFGKSTAALHGCPARLPCTAAPQTTCFATPHRLL